MKNVIATVAFSFLFIVFNNSALAKDITEVSHLEQIATYEVFAATNDVVTPVIVEGLDAGQEYLLAIVDGDGISIWGGSPPLTRTCHGRLKINRLTPDNTVYLFSLNGFGNSKDARSFFRFTPLTQDDRAELFISDEAIGDNQGSVEVGLFKVLKQLKNLDRGVK